jgi:tetratricopeptide (TPR) repeat protein
MANEAVIASFFGARGEMALPSTFVFDGNGTLERSYRRTISQKELVDATAEAAETAEEHRRNAVTLLVDGKRNEAIAALVRGLELDPDNPTARWRLGTVFLEGARVAEAVEHLELAARMAPDDPEIWADLSAAYKKAGRVEDYGAAVHRAAAQGRSARAQYYLGFYLKERGDEKGAELAFKRAIEIDPTLYKAYLNDRGKKPGAGR